MVSSPQAVCALSPLASFTKMEMSFKMEEWWCWPGRLESIEQLVTLIDSFSF
jgi:hypothetical protein